MKVGQQPVEAPERPGGDVSQALAMTTDAKLVIRDDPERREDRAEHLLMLPGGDDNRVEPMVSAKGTHDGRKFDCLRSSPKHDQHLETPASGPSQLIEWPTLMIEFRHVFSESRRDEFRFTGCRGHPEMR